MRVFVAGAVMGGLAGADPRAVGASGAMSLRAASAVTIPTGRLTKKDPVPVEGLGQDTAGQQADRTARARHECVDANRLGLLALLGTIVTIMPRMTAEVIEPPDALQEPGDHQ